MKNPIAKPEMSPTLRASSQLLRRALELYKQAKPTSCPDSRTDEATWVECSRQARLEILGHS